MGEDVTMRLNESPLSGLWEIGTAPRGDARGHFTRIFCADEFAVIRPAVRFVQVNHSVTALRGTVRGLHFQQAPNAEAKLIRCLRGAVFDVAVDLRPGSPTYGKWHGLELSAHNERQLFIPEGFAHGFQALTDDATLLYQHTTPYSASAESGIRYDDATVAISWPLPVTLISDRDLALPLLNVRTPGTAA